MRTKSTAKPAKAGSKLASIKNAIFGSGKKQQPEKASLPKNMKATETKKKETTKAQPQKSNSKTETPSKSEKSMAASKAPAKAAQKAAPAKASAPAKAAIAPAKGKNEKAAATAAPAPATSKKAAPVAKAVPVAAAAPAPTPALTKKPKKSPVSPLLGKSVSRRDHSEDCREVACEGLATAGGYCRLHYIKNWKKIKRKEIILKEGKLNQYIEELVVKYPDKYIEAIRQDLASDKDFAQVIIDLDLDESADDFEGDGENAEGLIDNIKGNFDDDGDAF